MRGLEEGVYIWDKNQSSCRDPKLCIVIDANQNVIHSKYQSHTFFIIDLPVNTTIDHYNSSLAIGLDSHLILSFY